VHEPEGLAIAFRVGGTEVAEDVLLGVAAFLRAEEEDPVRPQPGKPGHHRVVVGKQPVLKPGEHFEYTSGCVLETPRGSMRGSYQMHRPSGEQFDAEIASFALSMPFNLN